MNIEQTGGLDILPEYARSDDSFRVGAKTNSAQIFATTDDEIWKGGVSLVAPEDGSTASANWEIDEQRTAELWAFFDNEKLDIGGKVLLEQLLNLRPNYEQDINQWKISENTAL